MNHAEWKARRRRALLGEAVEGNAEYDRLYEEAELAHDLGQLVYDRRTALGLSQGREGGPVSDEWARTDGCGLLVCGGCALR
ncbi:hypothetical protein GCM10023080_085400 [Streptomyces pseudoechinosporeus]